MKKTALGRGLDVLLPDAETGSANTVREISINDIDRDPLQPRQNFNEENIGELAESIRSAGILQPLIVVETEGRYRIIAGERRYRAARKAGLETVPCIVRDMSETDKMEAALIENLQREDLNCIDEARAIRSLIEKCSYTQETAAKRLGKSRSVITNLLRILSLPESVIDMTLNGKISEGHARALCSLQNPSDQISIAEKIVKNGLSVRETESLCRSVSNKAPERPENKHVRSVPELTDLEERLRSVFGVKTQISGSVNKGKVVLQYSTRDELEAIYSCMEYLENR